MGFLMEKSNYQTSTSSRITGLLLTNHLIETVMESQPQLANFYRFGLFIAWFCFSSGIASLRLENPDQHSSHYPMTNISRLCSCQGQLILFS